MADSKEESGTPDTPTATATQAEGTTQSALAEKRISISPSSPRSEKRTCVIDKEFESNSSTTTESTAEGTQPQTRPWYKTSNPLRWGGIPPVPDERIISPEHNAGLLSRLTFGWVTTLMVTGYKRQLDERDIWKVNPDRAVDPLTQKVKESFQRRVEAGMKRPLLGALRETFKSEFWLSGIYALVYYSVQILTPFTLRYLIQFAADAYAAQSHNQVAPPIAHGIGLVLGIMAMQIIQSVTASQYFYKGMMLGGQSRGVLTGLIYEKAMTISSRAKAGGTSIATTPDPNDTEKSKQKATANSKTSEKRRDRRKKDELENGTGWTNGRISTLMSIDTNRIDMFCTALHSLWATPFACIISLVLLLVNLTYSALTGFALLAIGVPLFTLAIRSFVHRRRAINKITDQRISLTQEIIQSVRFVKYYGWEPAFLDRLEQLRMKEIHSIQALLAVRNAINAVSMSLPIFASMLSFITYSLTGNGLDPAKVFSSLALFNSLRLPLNLLPRALGDASDAYSSVMRIEHFLVQEDREEDMIWEPEGEYAIELRSASFTRERLQKHDSDESKDAAQGKDKKPKPDTEKSGPVQSTASSDGPAAMDQREPFQLHNVDFQAGRNELIAIIGSVGSGKSSLLAAMAGHMRKTDGDAIFGASRAFCPQYAWIQNTSLQNNITFGKELDQAWYDKIIDACALQADIDMLPDGDQTEIGERGITISGGQKQRLNIARAIYSDADIILMDDPLSAVDAHVGLHIFEKAILGLLKGKCLILVTHQLWVLDRCDRIAWMDAGKIQAIDSFENLKKNHQAFQTLMETNMAPKEKREQGNAVQVIEDLIPVEDTAKPKKVKKDQKASPLMQQEDRALDAVPWSVYAAYVRASGTIWNAPLVLLLLIASRGANISTNLWLSFWTSDKFALSTGLYIGIYAAVGAAQAVILFAFSLSLSVTATNASKTMFRQAMTRVLRAPISFFDTTPLGRIINRFSSDVDIMDNQSADNFRMFFITVSYAGAVFILIIAYYYYFAIALVPFYIFYVGAASYYRSSARTVKRYESVLRSKVVSRFIEGLSGVATIQAYSRKDQFVHELRSSIDSMNAAYYITFANQRWLTMRLDATGNLLIFVVGILVVTSRFSVNPSISGLVLSYILSVVQMLQFSIRQLSEVDKGINAVERLRYFGEELEEEAPLHIMDMPESWPDKGEIVLKNVEMRYRKNLPLVLQDLSIHINGGERMGIIGRTGAGKSSIISVLFRLVEISGGSISIDGIDISRIGLQDLRSRLTIVPQDPMLFQGTVRSNLDPFSNRTDMELWDALRRTGLTHQEDTGSDSHQANDVRIHLDSVVEEDGLNFSLGQRQLMALARALVRDSRIIICDEATSSVDMETDEKIQVTMAAGFSGKTVLCIAHRLRTIIGYDRICVVDAGQIAELDTPANLFAKADGIFRSMCNRSGIQLEDIKASRDTITAFGDANRR